MLAALSAVPAGTSGVVIVTVLDRAMLSDTYIQRIKKNREDYVKRHGRLMQWLMQCLVARTFVTAV